MRLPLNQTEEGVCPIVVVILGRRGIGKTKLMEAAAPLMSVDRKKLVIVSPIPTLKVRMPDVPWYKISVANKLGIEKLFRGWMEAKDKEGNPIQRFVLADEADELTAANAAGTAGGFVAQAVYDYINYGREQGLGIMLSSRRPANIAKDVCANANLVFVGNTVDPAALDYYSAWMQDPMNPEINYRAKCRVLPDHWFMVWSPTADEKFLGYVKVNPATMEIEPMDPDSIRESPVAPDASDTEDSTTTDTRSTEKGSDSVGSAAASAERTSRTAPGPSSAPTAGS
jgi:hypothetical protein